MASLRASSRSPLLQVLKTSVAAILAWLVSAAALGQPLPIFAAIAALLVVQPSVNQSLAKGIERSVGVIFGVLLAFGAGSLFGNSSWIVLGVIVVSLLSAWALRLSPGSANQIPISAMLVIALGANTPGYALNRVIETVIGAVIGLAVNAIIVPPVLLAPAHDAVVGLAESVADILSAFATALSMPQTGPELSGMLSAARRLPELRNSATDALVRADESLMLNPRRARYRERLEHDRDLLDSLGILVTRVTGMARALHDNYDSRLTDDAFVASISIEFERAAHDLRLLAHESTTLDPAPTSSELPALTAPLTIALPDPDNWILVGSLLEDLRRVREVIIGENVA
ncbi:MAG: FUSC family protein [Actinomycetota bacterium]